MAPDDAPQEPTPAERLEAAAKGFVQAWSEQMVNIQESMQASAAFVSCHQGKPEWARTHLAALRPTVLRRIASAAGELSRIALTMAAERE